MALKWLTERLDDPNNWNTPALQPAMEEITSTRAYIEDMAVITRFGRRLGGAGDAKVIGEIPMGLYQWLAKYQPDVLMDKKAAHEFLRQNRQFAYTK